jgi:hypothetical protein
MPSILPSWPKRWHPSAGRGRPSIFCFIPELLSKSQSQSTIFRALADTLKIRKTACTMINQHNNAAHRLLVLRKLENLAPRPPTNSAKARPKASDNRTIPQLAASITGKIEELRSVLSEARGSTAPPAAVARKVETAARRTAAELSAARREATKSAGNLTAEAFRESQAKPSMSRTEFLKLDHPGRNAAMKAGVRLVD